MTDLKTFFASVRSSLFRGRMAKAQVDGINVILAECETWNVTDPRWIAYILATAYHETAHTMQPLREFGRGKGRAYGGTDSRTGHIYYGRGFVQLTWKANYARAGERLGLDLVNDPDLALEERHAAAILVLGMVEGWFTGVSLDAFFNDRATDWRRARKIVNGLDRARLIAGYARKFHTALTAPSESVLALLTQPMEMKMMKGFRTVLINAAIAGLVAMLAFLADVDWTQYMDPTFAMILVAVVNGAMRWVTTTPIFKKE